MDVVLGLWFCVNCIFCLFLYGLYEIVNNVCSVWGKYCKKIECMRYWVLILGYEVYDLVWFFFLFYNV